MKLLDHLSNDACGVFVLSTFAQRDKFITCSVFHQVRAFIMLQETHSPMPIKTAQRYCATLFIYFCWSQKFENNSLSIMCDSINLTRHGLCEKLRIKKIPCGEVMIESFIVTHGRIHNSEAQSSMLSILIPLFEKEIQIE